MARVFATVALFIVAAIAGLQTYLLRDTRETVAQLAAIIANLPRPPPAPPPAKPVAVYPNLTEEVIAKLKVGGLVLFVRHAPRGQREDVRIHYDLATHTDKLVMPPEADTVDSFCLGDYGKDSARILGAYLKIFEIPIAKVYVSPICRCVQTAELAFGRIDRKVNALSFIPLIYGSDSSKQAATREVAAFFKSLSTPVGGNLALVSHVNYLKHIGIDDRSLGEAGFYVMELTKEGPKIVAAATLSQLALFGYLRQLSNITTSSLGGTTE